MEPGPAELASTCLLKHVHWLVSACCNLLHLSTELLGHKQIWMETSAHDNCRQADVHARVVYHMLWVVRNDPDGQ